jgi:CRP/FNR family transcriptional regulator
MENWPQLIKHIGKVKKIGPAEFLFHSGDEAGGMYYIQAGEVRVYQMDEEGRELEVVRLGPGDFLGEAILFVNGRFPFFAQAVKETAVVFFDKKAVFREIESHPAIAKFFLQLLARKCVALSGRVEAIGLQTVRQRLVHYLIANCSGEKQCCVELKMRKSQLAKHLGTGSETLSRNLRQLQKENLISVRGLKIFIKDCPRLRSR